MFDTKLQIEDFEFYRYDRSDRSDYSFELALADDTILEAEIEIVEIRSGRETYDTIDYIEVGSEHILDADEIEEIEELLRENLEVIFNTAQQIV
jgi:hypothetical protein